VSGDCGHGWGYHFLGPSHSCFACAGYWTRDEALAAVITLRGQNADLKARLKLIRTRGQCLGLEEWTAVTDLRRLDWRKP
jgi:hypothetical protein